MHLRNFLRKPIFSSFQLQRLQNTSKIQLKLQLEIHRIPIFDSTLQSLQSTNAHRTNLGVSDPMLHPMGVPTVQLQKS